MPSLTGVQTCALRSEEHTSELQSLTNLVCRLLLEKIITDGPFKDQEGKVSEIDEEGGKVKVLVSMFGRETPVELDFFFFKEGEPTVLLLFPIMHTLRA